MAVRDTISRQAAEEEAEVDVLKSHLETRAQMTKKINGNRAKVEDAGRKLDQTVASLGGETQKLQDMLKSTCNEPGHGLTGYMAACWLTPFLSQISEPPSLPWIISTSRPRARMTRRAPFAWGPRRPA